MGGLTINIGKSSINSTIIKFNSSYFCLFFRMEQIVEQIRPKLKQQTTSTKEKRGQPKC